MQKIEVWYEDNYDYMKGESFPVKIAEFDNVEDALDYMCSKLDEELCKLAKNAKSPDDLIHLYKFGGHDYYIKGTLIFSSWNYVEQEAKRIFENCKKV